MPYIKGKAREEIFDHGLRELSAYLRTVSMENRKGFVAFAVAYLAKWVFPRNYFGISTGLDALRSAYQEMKTDLDVYEMDKRAENGEV